MILPLQSLRGIFAIFIFFHHIIYNGKSLFMAGGDFGVAFFFILSGFVMSAAYENRITSPSFRYFRYLRSRFFRLYPSYLLILLLFAVYSIFKYDSDFPFGPFAASLLTIQSWIPIETYYFSLNAPGWCIGGFLFSYALFPFALKLLRKEGKWIHLGGLFLFIIYFSTIQLIPAKMQTGLIYICPAFRFFDFVLGMYLYRLIGRNHYEIVSRRNANLFEIISILTSVVAILLYPVIHQKYALDSFWWLPCGMLIVSFTLSGNNGCISKLLCIKPAVYFGNISYSFYLVHYFIICMLANIHSIASNITLFTSVALILSVISAIILHHYIEQPAERQFNKRIRIFR